MAGSTRRLRSLVGLIAALVVALGWAVAPAVDAAPAVEAPAVDAASPPRAEPGAESAAPQVEAELPAWDGGINLYRSGVFTTQKSWLWCTAAGVQIVRNIVERDDDHRRASQRRYFDWMRERNRYDLPLSAGVDPQGWAAGLRHFVDDRYRLVASKTFDGALRSAVKRLRQTNLPVALTVADGNHGWILTGFTATADPAVTSEFTVRSVRVTGPLYGRQSRNGYDMRPNTKLTPRQLRRFFTPWDYKPRSMVWDGRYISIQPSGQPAETQVKAPTPAPRVAERAFGAWVSSPMAPAASVVGLRVRR